jgi:hypothetical protein
MFPTVINNIIAEYAAEYKLLPWIDIKKINWTGLSENPNAVADTAY